MPLNSKLVTTAARAMVDGFENLIERQHTESLVDQTIDTVIQKLEADQIVDAFIRTLKETLPDHSTPAGWLFLRNACLASFELMKRGEDPSRLLSHIYTIDGDTDGNTN